MISGDEYKLWSSSLCNFLHSPVTSSLLGPNILLRTLFSNILSLCSSLSVRDQGSYYHITKYKQGGSMSLCCRQPEEVTGPDDYPVPQTLSGDGRYIRQLLKRRQSGTRHCLRRIIPPSPPPPPLPVVWQAIQKSVPVFVSKLWEPQTYYTIWKCLCQRDRRTPFNLNFLASFIVSYL
jgi:hypothetical protein